MSNRDGLAAFKMSFDLAAHVIIAAFLVAVLIAQMDIYLCDVITKAPPENNFSICQMRLCGMIV